MWRENYEGFKKWIFIAMVLACGGMFYQMLWTYIKMPFRRKGESVIIWIFNGAFTSKYIQYTVANIAVIVGITGLTIIAFLAISKWLRDAYSDLENGLAREGELKAEKQVMHDSMQKEITDLGTKNKALSEDVENLQKEILKVREEKGLNPEVKARLSEFSTRRKEPREQKESSAIPIIGLKEETSSGRFLFQPSKGTVTPVNEKKETSKEKSLHDDLKDLVRETLKEMNATDKKEEPKPVEKLPVPAKESVVEPVTYQPPQPTNITIEQNVTNKSTCGTCFKWFIIFCIIGTIANLIWWKMLLGQFFK